MRTLPPELAASLAEGATTLCWCFRLESADGSLMGFTDHDRDLAFDGVTYEAMSGFAGSEIETSLGLSVDDLEASGALSSERLNEADLAAGVFDAAKVEIWLVDWQEVASRLLLRRGTLGEVTRAGSAFTAEVRGLAQALDQPRGRLFQAACDADLGDARCGVDLADPTYRGEGAVEAAQDARRFFASGLDGFEPGWFSRGRLLWTSGANAGRAMEVKAHRVTAAGVAIELWHPMSETVAAADEFSVTAGCDKQFGTCRARFGNHLNFRGFPHMPGNDFVTLYPNADDGSNDGGSLL